MKFFGKVLAYPLLAVNILTALLLIFSCYGSLAAPMGRLPFASLSGLAFPFLYVFNLLFLILWLMTWKKGSIVSAVTVLVCLVPTLNWFPLHFARAGKVQKPYITVATYNTEGFGIVNNKDWTLNNPVLGYTLGLDADIILLQEATHFLTDNASKEKEIRSVFPYVGLPDGLNGEACLSRYPIILNQAIHFENTKNACQYLRILVGKDTLAVYNCHFQSNQLNKTDISEYQSFIMHPTDSTHYKTSKKVVKRLLESTAQRAVQARMIADRVRGETARYVIVCGDFNDTPLSYSHRQFDRFMNDTYAMSGAGAGITYHEHRLYYRIDHIFCSRNITPLHTFVDRSQKGSDHYPVISRIRLE